MKSHWAKASNLVTIASKHKKKREPRRNCTASLRHNLKHTALLIPNSKDDRKS